VFKGCNVDDLEQVEERGLYLRNNFFDRPRWSKGGLNSRVSWLKLWPPGK